jgi:FMN phosphatase YigB (HAD superfamily)
MNESNIRNIKGIIFDLGYTLIEYKEDNWPAVNLKSKQDTYNRLLDEKLPLPPFEQFDTRYETIKEEYRSAAFDEQKGWKLTDVLIDLFKEYKIDDPAKYARLFVEIFYDSGQDMMYVEDGTVETLKHIKNLGLKIGIISNTIFPADVHDKILERYGLKPYLDFAIFSSEFGWRKPHPKIFEEGIRLMGFAPSEIMYVGDRYNMDALGAQAVGMQPVLKHCTKREYPDPMPNNIPTIYFIKELPGLLPSKINTTELTDKSVKT